MQPRLLPRVKKGSLLLCLGARLARCTSPHLEFLNAISTCQIAYSAKDLQIETQHHTSWTYSDQALLSLRGRKRKKSAKLTNLDPLTLQSQHKMAPNKPALDLNAMVNGGKKNTRLSFADEMLMWSKIVSVARMNSSPRNCLAVKIADRARQGPG